MPKRLMDPNYVYQLSDGSVLNTQDPSRGDVFGFGVASGPDDQQEQKWILFTKRREYRPPTRPRTLQRAAHFPAPMNNFWDDRNKFDENVRHTFSEAAFPEGHYYVRVRSARVYGKQNLPQLVRPAVATTGEVTIQQPDIGTMQIYSSDLAAVTGLLIVVKHDRGTTEHWLLSARYSEYHGNWIQHVSAEQFESMIDRRTWDDTWTLVSCACDYYEARSALPLTQEVTTA